MMVATARDAADLMAPLFAGLAGEKVAIAHLDARRRLIALDEHPGEATDEAGLPMREIVAAALRRDSRGLILAHNHPSGDPSPSGADIEATRRLADTLAGLGIRVHDHLVFAGSECRSFRELGLL